MRCNITQNDACFYQPASHEVRNDYSKNILANPADILLSKRCKKSGQAYKFFQWLKASRRQPDFWEIDDTLPRPTIPPQAQKEPTEKTHSESPTTEPTESGDRENPRRKYNLYGWSVDTISAKNANFTNVFNSQYSWMVATENYEAPESPGHL